VYSGGRKDLVLAAVLSEVKKGCCKRCLDIHSGSFIFLVSVTICLFCMIATEALKHGGSMFKKDRQFIMAHVKNNLLA